MQMQTLLDTTRLLAEPLFQLDNGDRLTMTRMACSNSGRLIMAASDGNIYEINYTVGTGTPDYMRIY